jgi:Transposase
MDGAFLNWALQAFSGYVAADELYEGPYCVLSAVDNRQYKRILYKVLDHDPSHDDIMAFLLRLKTALHERNLELKGITTDGAALYPDPIREVFGEVPHQLCTFHVIKELTKGVLRAVASERKRLAQSKPKLKRGRPSSTDKAARRVARTNKAMQQKISDLFQNRFLFVKRRLTPSERKRLLHITRGLPHLRKLREIMEHIYALFDRRCRTPTALGKRKKLRQWVNRFTWMGDTLKKVFSPHLEKALTFLDDKLLPATSNAVERGNRRHRKMQKSVYRVRSQACLEGRIALDMIRESRAEGRSQTTQVLHQARRGST